MVCKFKDDKKSLENCLLSSRDPGTELPLVYTETRSYGFGIVVR